jgi:hypothetical protein
MSAEKSSRAIKPALSKSAGRTGAAIRPARKSRAIEGS